MTIDRQTDDFKLIKSMKYELMFLKLSWVFLAAGFGYFLINEFVLAGDAGEHMSKGWSVPVMWKLVFCLAAIVLHFIKHYLFNKNLLEMKFHFFTNRIAWLFLISFGIIFIDLGIWLYIIILFAILVTTLTRGLKAGLVLVTCSFTIHLSLFAIAFLTGLADPGLLSTDISENFILLVFLYFMFVLFTMFCGMIFKDNIENEKENRHLMEQLEEKYLQLEVAQDEIKLQYEKLKGTNSKLEEINKRLSDSIAEFYTLQQISQAIGSILDIGELMKYLNDIIIGVMGVNYSTILLHDEKSGRLKVQATNITNLKELSTLSDNVNYSILTNVMDSGQYFLENYVDQSLYTFTEGREVNSLICVPLNTKSRKYGLVLVEHKLSSAFDDDNVRLLDIISQQVGIALENADLYQKMQELASRDGLTGLYNRQYFQKRLDAEFRNAQNSDYLLSVAIFDIDHFKRFNDTFGHMFGDKVLKSISDAVSGHLRKNDILARYGGEEFILLFPRTNISEAYEKVESLRKMIGKLIVKDNLVTASVTVSFGVSCFDECALSENELLRSADDALYEAKASGRNCVRVAKKLID